MSNAEQTPARTRSYTVARVHLGDLTTQLDRLVRRAVKLGVEGLTYTVGEPRLEEDLEVVDVTVAGSPPSLAGWSFVATIEPFDGKNMIRAVPNTTVPVAYRDADPEHCDHCQTRRRRNATFVLHHEATGEYTQVGRTCVADFLGHQLPSGFEGLIRDLSDLDEYAGSLGRGEPDAWDLAVFLRFVACYIRQSGWVSRTAARDSNRTSTATNVLNCLWNWEKLNPDEHAYWVTTKTDQETTAKAIAWAQGLTEAEIQDSDYLYNVSLVVGAGYTTVRTAGIAASIIAAYQRTLARQAARATDLTSEHFGEVKKRSTYKVTLIRETGWHTHFGYQRLYVFRTQEGNVATWKTSSAFRDTEYTEVEVGDTITVKATVKDHDTYKDVKQTVLTRVAAQGKVEECE